MMEEIAGQELLFGFGLAGMQETLLGKCVESKRKARETVWEGGT